MPRGASPRREREYEEIKKKMKQRHEYPGREEEVAARIVNKQRREAGETKDQKGRGRSSSTSRSSKSRSSKSHSAKSRGTTKSRGARSRSSR